MATHTVVNANVDQEATPVANAMTASDQFAASSGAKYLVRVNNTGGSAIAVVFDDPTSQAPIGATQFVPDLTFDVPNGAARARIIDANRFRASDGFVKYTTTPAPTATMEIYGPLPA